MIRKLSLILLTWAALAIPMAACAQVATLPVVRGPGGQAVPAQAHICVDLTGAYISCGGAGGGGGSLSAKANAASQTSTEGATTDPLSMDLHRSLRVLNMDASGNVLDTNAATPAGTNIIGKVGIDQTTAGTTNGVVVNSSALPTGAATAAKQMTLDASGAGIVPQAGAANRVLTATTLSLNTNATICPAATNPVATEIFFTTAGVGVGLNGQTLTAATPGGTTTNSPDIAIGTANTLYTAPVGVSNAITGYGAAGVVRCIQTLRQ